LANIAEPQVTPFVGKFSIRLFGFKRQKSHGRMKNMDPAWFYWYENS